VNLVEMKRDRGPLWVMLEPPCLGIASPGSTAAS
jgi:hypothetical protein